MCKDNFILEIEASSVSIPSLAELDEDWYHSDDPINAGVTFFVKVGLYCPYHTRTHTRTELQGIISSIIYHLVCSSIHYCTQESYY